VELDYGPTGRYWSVQTAGSSSALQWLPDRLIHIVGASGSEENIENEEKPEVMQRAHMAELADVLV
jgi:hypothetical protein